MFKGIKKFAQEIFGRKRDADPAEASAGVSYPAPVDDLIDAEAAQFARLASRKRAGSCRSRIINGNGRGAVIRFGKYISAHQQRCNKLMRTA
jgi:hypothetical protein